MKTSLCTAIVLLITACTSGTSTFSVHIPAEAAITSEAAAMPLDKITKDINYIPLQTTEESLIKEVKSFISDKNNIYINDAKRQCLKFTSDGKFVCKIGSKGRGPNEYLNVEEIFLNNDKIHIYDAYSYSVLTYTLSGEFVSKTVLDGYLAGHMSVDMLPNGKIVTFTPDKGPAQKNVMLAFAQLPTQESEVVILDSIPHPKPLIESANVTWYFKEGQFVQDGKELSFKCTLNDTIYNITEKDNKYSISPKYIFDLGQYAAINDARVQTSKSLLSSKPFNAFKVMAQIELLGESKKYIFYRVTDEPVYFFDKDNGIVNKWLFSIKDKEKECKENPKFYTPIKIDSNGNLLGVMLPDKEEDNPVLVIAKLK